jgi:hypothetical protein
MVVFADWETAAARIDLAIGRVHVVALDPPYRSGHVDLLRRMASDGVAVHLYYGPDQREGTARLLRYLEHPRFAMVCAYRAKDGAGDHGGDGSTLRVRAARLAWEEAQVVLGHAAVSRALEILELLGTDQARPGEAKLDARDVPAYLLAEADYEECSRLCQNL